MTDDVPFRTQPIPTGTPVEVRAGLEPRFCAGFEVAATHADGYRLRRRSDRSELPALFRPEDVRRDRS